MADDLVIYVRLSPKASRNAVGKWFRDENNRPVLKASVTAVPEKGKANEALIDLLSAHWGIAKRCITLKSGLTDKNKSLIIKDISPEKRQSILQGQ